MEVSDYIGCVASEGDLFAAAAEHGDLAVEIEPCPGWDMRELVCHLGIVHLWAASNITYPKDDWLIISDLSDLAGHWPDLATEWPENADLRPGTAASDRALITWYRATHANLVRVLQSAPADVEAFTWLPAPSPLAMWARRQASEIAIHRFDAESARGIATRFDPHFASDMLDELLSGFGPIQSDIHTDSERRLHVHAEDTDDHWWLTIGPQGIETSRHGTDANLDRRRNGTRALPLDVEPHARLDRAPDRGHQRDGCLAHHLPSRLRRLRGHTAFGLHSASSPNSLDDGQSHLPLHRERNDLVRFQLRQVRQS